MNIVNEFTYINASTRSTHELPGIYYFVHKYIAFCIPSLEYRSSTKINIAFVLVSQKKLIKG